MIHLRRMATAFHRTPGERKQMSFNWSERVVSTVRDETIKEVSMIYIK